MAPKFVTVQTQLGCSSSNEGQSYPSLKAMPDLLEPSVQPHFHATDQGSAVNGSALGEMPVSKVPVTGSAQSAHLPPPSLPGDVAMADWHDLLNAVKTRLLQTASDDFVESRDLRIETGLVQVQAEMIDCVAALNQLHTTLTHELERYKNLKSDIDLAQAALARKHHELMGSQALERRSRHLANHDALTSLPNRLHFSQRLGQALAAQLETAERGLLAVLFLDLDYFKQVNDLHGHAKGDEVLKIVATRLIHAIRVEDCVSRLGGDEFACLLGGFPDRQQLGLHASKVLTSVAAPMLIGELSLCIRPSIGIALYPDDGLTGPALLEHADAAMYVAKKRGSGYAFYDEIAQY